MLERTLQARLSSECETGCSLELGRGALSGQGWHWLGRGAESRPGVMAATLCVCPGLTAASPGTALYLSACAVGVIIVPVLQDPGTSRHSVNAHAHGTIQCTAFSHCRCL